MANGNERSQPAQLTTEENRNRPTSDPGGCECFDCGCIFIGGPDHDYCAVCQQNRDESAYERSLGECFRGDEAAAFEAEQMAEARRLK